MWAAETIRDANDEKTRIICFHLEQYVEKSIKAKLLQLDISYPKTHDIVVLLEILLDKNIFNKHLDNASFISDYATRFRYASRIPTVEEMEIAFESAKAIVSDVMAVKNSK